MHSSDTSELRGRFRVDTEIARGGMGAVFVAFDTVTGQKVALKRLSPDAPPRAAALFEREFYVLSTLRHPRIIDVYEYGLDAEGPFYTMELLEGSDLRELSPLAPLVACRYLRDIASSLALLHARRLLHRDVSPRNVRTLPGGGCKLIDFGALASFGTSEDVVGTPPAIAPEALAGQALDQRTDLYSLGALAYFLLTGRQAYAARSINALPDAWAMQVTPPSLLAPDVPEELDALVLAMLSLDVLGRPTSATEVIERLNTIANLEPEHDARIASAYFIGAAPVERDNELESAQRRLERAKAGRGAALLITGAAGVGKTRLLSEITLRAQLTGITALRVDAAEQIGNLATARALVQQVRRLLPRVAAKVFAPHDAQFVAAWPDWLSGISAKSDTAPQVTPEDVRKAALATIPSLLEACLLEVAKVQGLLIAVDNVERTDAPSAALLLALVKCARSEPLLVIATTAEAVDTDSVVLRSLRQSTKSVPLRELSERGTLALVRSAFGDVPGLQRTAKRLHTATSGNPAHCMQLLTRWVTDGLISYVGGSFSLPIDIPVEALLPYDRMTRDRLTTCSLSAQDLARTLSVLNEPVAFDTCLGLAADHGSVLRDIDELLRAEVLLQNAYGLRFSQDELRRAAFESMDAASREARQLLVGEYLLVRSDGKFQRQAEAGLHILRGGQAERGALVIARAARATMAAGAAPADFARSVVALEAALVTYRQMGRSRLEQLDLLVPLVIASYDISVPFAMRYGDATLEALTHALGLADLAARAQPPDAAELFGLLAAAPVLGAGESRTPSTPDVTTLVSWLSSCVLTLVSTVSVAIDHAAEQRFADALSPFRVFGPTHPTALAYDYCNLIIAMTQDHFAAAHRGWSEMVLRCEQATLPATVRRALRMGALCSLGILECQRDDDSVLARFAELEEDGTPRSLLMLDQLRFLYHGFRGELVQAEHHRDRVEAHAVQYGSAWQVEIWSTSTLTAVYGNTRDVAGNKRAVAQLQRLKRDMPSLERYWGRAVAMQKLLAGDYVHAAESVERELAEPGARDRVGWVATRAALARAYNELGQHARAKQLGEETLRAAADDLDYVAMTLHAPLELVRSLGGLGELAEADRLLAELFARYQQNKNPVTLGSLHRTAAELAQLRGDVLEFEHHLEAMQSYHLPTKNPALIAQCERLRNLNTSGRDLADTDSDNSGFTLAQPVPSSTLLTTHTTASRKQRALELVATQAGAKDAFLFTRGWHDEAVLLGSLRKTQPSNDLLDAVHAMFEDIPDDAEETAFVPGGGSTTATEVHRRHRLLPLTVLHEDKHMLIGTIAVSDATIHRPVSYALLNELALQLFRAGDMICARTLG